MSETTRPPMSQRQIERAGEVWPAQERAEGYELDVAMNIVRDALPWAKEQARKIGRDFSNMRHNGGNE